VTTLVLVPYYGCPELVERAVRSVLAQTVRDIAVLVIGDGEEPPLHGITDSRLDVYTLPENRGPYFAQQVGITASPFPWYAPHAADDWSEPDHLERLFEVGGPVVFTGAVHFHTRHGTAGVHYATYEVGLYATEALRAIGGHNPNERMGQDSLLIHLLRMTGEPRATTHPTYHRVKRHGSLMTHPDTAPGSPARNRVRERNRVVLAECARRRTLPRIRAYREHLPPVAVRAEVAYHAARVAERLGQEVAA
jgi:glycosyltransferase involved in cell wall biosynthesis